MSNPGARLRFSSFEVIVEVGELRRYGRRIKLQEKPFQILLALLERPGALVSREELHQRLWPDNTFVDFDHNLNNAVDKLRKALNDSVEAPKFVETLPRRGYRFIGTVALASVLGTSEVVESTGVREVPPPLDPPVTVQSQPSTVTSRSSLVREAQLPDPAEVTASAATAPRQVSTQRIIRDRNDSYWKHALAAFLLVLAVSAGALLILRTARGSQKASSARFERLLILPVQNLTANPEEDYLSDGLTEEMIRRVGKLDASTLGVIAPTTAMRLKQSAKSPTELGRELHVDYVIEASLRQSEGNNRISVQLVRVTDQLQMWTADYERSDKNLFGISNEVAASVGKQLRLHSTRRTDRTGLPEGTKNSQAYEYYLKGRFFWNKRLKEDVAVAVEYFSKAVAEDPNYAKAYAGLADSYIVLAGSHMPSQTAFEKARESAEKAIFLDQTLGEPHTSLAYIMYAENWDWAGAEREYKKSIEVDPQYAIARHWYFVYLTAMKRYPEAITHAEKALELDPLSQSINYNAAMTYIIAGQHERGLQQLEKAIELDPSNPVSYGYLGLLYEREQKYHEAAEEFQKAEGFESEKFSYMFDVAGAYAREGKGAEARRIAAELNAYSKKHYLNPYWFVAMYTGFGDRDKAITWLDLAVQQHSCTALEINTDSRLDFLRSDARFKKAIKPMNLPE